MNLYILRHGIATEPGIPGSHRDSERPLTPKGERKLKKIAQAMEAMDLGFDLILSSPYLRAHQTARIIADAFNTRKRLELCDALTPDGSPKNLIDLLNELDPAPGNVLLVGHEPYLSELISLLASGSTRTRILLKKGGLCKLSTEALQHGACASLEWLLAPKQMELMV